MSSLKMEAYNERRQWIICLWTVAVCFTFVSSQSSSIPVKIVFRVAQLPQMVAPTIQSGININGYSAQSSEGTQHRSQAKDSQSNLPAIKSPPVRTGIKLHSATVTDSPQNEVVTRRVLKSLPQRLSARIPTSNNILQNASPSPEVLNAPSYMSGNANTVSLKNNTPRTENNPIEDISQGKISSSSSNQRISITPEKDSFVNKLSFRPVKPYIPEKSKIQSKLESPTKGTNTNLNSLWDGWLYRDNTQKASRQVSSTSSFTQNQGGTQQEILNPSIFGGLWNVFQPLMTDATTQAPVTTTVFTNPLDAFPFWQNVPQQKTSQLAQLPTQSMIIGNNVGVGNPISPLQGFPKNIPRIGSFNTMSSLPVKLPLSPTHSQWKSKGSAQDIASHLDQTPPNIPEKENRINNVDSQIIPTIPVKSQIIHTFNTPSPISNTQVIQRNIMNMPGISEQTHSSRSKTTSVGSNRISQMDLSNLDLQAIVNEAERRASVLTSTKPSYFQSDLNSNNRQQTDQFARLRQTSNQQLSNQQNIPPIRNQIASYSNRERASKVNVNSELINIPTFRNNVRVSPTGFSNINNNARDKSSLSNTTPVSQFVNINSAGQNQNNALNVDTQSILSKLQLSGAQGVDMQQMMLDTMSKQLGLGSNSQRILNGNFADRIGNTGTETVQSNVLTNLARNTITNNAPPNTPAPSIQKVVSSPLNNTARQAKVKQILSMIQQQGGSSALNPENLAALRSALGRDISPNVPGAQNSFSSPQRFDNLFSGMPTWGNFGNLGGSPEVPGLQQMAGMPQLPGMMQIPGMPQLPEMLPLPGMPQLPGIPPLSGMPQFPGPPQLAGMLQSQGMPQMPNMANMMSTFMESRYEGRPCMAASIPTPTMAMRFNPEPVDPASNECECAMRQSCNAPDYRINNLAVTSCGSKRNQPMNPLQMICCCPGL